MNNVEINAPWGSMLHKKDDTNGNIKTIKHCLKQLEYFRDFQFNTTTYLKREIEAYIIIINSDDPELNAMKFLITKRKINHSKDYDNLNIIDLMKSEGLWV